MIINCDIGERGPDHPVDVALMDWIQLANIACGGHAGDKDSVKAFRTRAENSGVQIAAHLSYPDRDHFGRTSMNIPMIDLQESLDEQLILLPDIYCVKFHGALYNDLTVNKPLAEQLTEWLLRKGITQVVTPHGSELDIHCQQAGIGCLHEAFAERRYDYNPDTKRLTLVSRKKAYASISDCQEALEHAGQIIKFNQVSAYIKKSDGLLEERLVSIKADTLCIHSDSTVALGLAQGLKQLLDDGVKP
jgi:UPF0271 protein